MSASCSCLRRSIYGSGLALGVGEASAATSSSARDAAQSQRARDVPKRNVRLTACHFPLRGKTSGALRHWRKRVFAGYVGACGL
jgi:hypothetical protein